MGASLPGTGAVSSVQRAAELASLNAFVTVVDRPARAAEGPLHGLPFAAKDVIDTAGIRTTRGSRHFEHYVPKADAECVEVLVRSGAVLVGKTTTHEFANGPVGDSSLNGAARNPHDPGRITGGSSAGSASAVAAGIVPLALGTDTGGSSRIPAALCGVVGFKPTFGALPLRGVFPLAPTFDTLGLLTRDAALLGRVWEMFSPGQHEPAGTRIGVLSAAVLPAVDPELDRVVRAFVDPLGPIEVSLPALPQLWDVYRRIHGAEAHAIHRERLTSAPELFQPDVRERLESAEGIRGWQYVAALGERRRLQSEMLAVFDSVDILALPTTPIVAPPLGVREVDLAGRPVPVREALLSLTHPWSVLGWPAASVPAGTLDGLPVGVQFVAAPGRDAALIEFIQQFSN